LLAEDVLTVFSKEECIEDIREILTKEIKLEQDA
jgi:hypothetical protein